METKDSNILLDVSLTVNANIILHEKGRESLFDPDDITGVREAGGKTILTWSYNNGEYEYVLKTKGMTLDGAMAVLKEERRGVESKVKALAILKDIKADLEAVRAVL